MKRRRLPIPQYEFSFVAETFNLMLEISDDGERIARERADAEQVRLDAEKAQVLLPHSGRFQNRRTRKVKTLNRSSRQKATVSKNVS